MKLLLAAKARTTETDGYARRTPLMLAARNGRHEALHVLLDAGAEIDAVDEDGWPALLHAVGGNRPEVCRLLLNRGASRTRQGGT